MLNSKIIQPSVLIFTVFISDTHLWHCSSDIASKLKCLASCIINKTRVFKTFRRTVCVHDIRAHRDIMINDVIVTPPSWSCCDHDHTHYTETNERFCKVHYYSHTSLVSATSTKVNNDLIRTSFPRRHCKEELCALFLGKKVWYIWKYSMHDLTTVLVTFTG